MKTEGRVYAKITPSVMKWARESANIPLDAAAEKFQITIERMKRWENGEERPTVSQMQNKVCKFYRRPLAVFYLPAPPKDFSPLKDFRRLPSAALGYFPTELIFLMREAEDKQTWLREYLTETDGHKLEFVGSAGLNQSPASVAAKIRKHIGLTLEMQKSWNGQRDAALRKLREMTEAIGIFVMQHGGGGKGKERLDVSDVRGFAISDEYAPLIFLNSNDSPAGRCFSLCHELTHLWLNSSGVSNLSWTSDTGNIPDEGRTEIFCNKVASHILVPEKAFEDIWNEDMTGNDLEENIASIARFLCVSEAVIARRLYDNSSISKSKFEELHHKYSMYRAKARPVSESGGPSFYTMKVFQNGKALIQTVIMAYHEGFAGSIDICGLLGVKTNHLNSLAIEAGLPGCV